MRFKPPPALDSEIGWRVEFRTLDVQITDFENAAWIALLQLLVQFLTKNPDYDTSLPISQCDENMERAHSRDAVNTQNFFWKQTHTRESTDFSEMTLNEIFNGSESCKGLIPILT